MMIKSLKINLLTLALFSISSCKPLEKYSNEDVSHQPVTEMLGDDKIDVWNQGVSDFFQDSIVLQLVDEAVKNNLLLKQTKGGIGQARAELVQAKGLSKPFLEGTTGAGVRRYGFYTQEGIGNWDANFSPNLTEDMQLGRNLPDYMGGFLASWEIDVWGKLKRKRKSAMYGLLASEEGYNWLRMQITTKTINEYATLIALLQKKEILSSSIKIQNSALSYARIQKEMGGVNQLVINQFEARLNNFKAKGKQLDLEIQHQYNALNLVLGRYPKDVPIQSELLANPPHISFERSPQELFDNRPDIRQAMLRLEQSGADIEVARRAFYPSLQLSGLLGLQTFNANFFVDPSSITFSVFGNVLGPLLNRSAQKSMLAFSKATHEKNFYALQEKVLEAYYDVLNQTLAMDYLMEQLEIKAEEVSITKIAIDNALQLFKTGRAGYLDVLTVQSDALSSQVELVDIQHAVFMARINLYRSLGGF